MIKYLYVSCKHKKVQNCKIFRRFVLFWIILLLLIIKIQNHWCFQIWESGYLVPLFLFLSLWKMSKNVRKILPKVSLDSCVKTEPTDDYNDYCVNEPTDDCDSEVR